jgi:hypothetical protein
MGECTGGVYPGYLWMLLPSLPYCSNPTGCIQYAQTGCTGCGINNRCIRQPGLNTCSGGCSSCTGYEFMITPPQIVYIGDLDINKAPLGATGYKGFTGAPAVTLWLVDNHAKALYWGGTGHGLILKDMGTDYTVCEQRPFTAQYINLVTYNTISKESVCFANGTLGTPNCFSL